MKLHNVEKLANAKEVHDAFVALTSKHGAVPPDKYVALCKVISDVQGANEMMRNFKKVEKVFNDTETEDILWHWCTFVRWLEQTWNPGRILVALWGDYSEDAVKIRNEIDVAEIKRALVAIDPIWQTY